MAQPNCVNIPGGQPRVIKRLARGVDDQVFKAFVLERAKTGVAPANDLCIHACLPHCRNEYYVDRGNANSGKIRKGHQ